MFAKKIRTWSWSIPATRFRERRSQYYHNKKNNQPPDPMMLAMSALNYDSMAVGNHEYNFGLKVLEKARSEANFPGSPQIPTTKEQTRLTTSRTL